MNRFLISLIFIISSCTSNIKKDPTTDLPYKMYKDYKVEIRLNNFDTTSFTVIKKHFNSLILPDFKWEYIDANSVYLSFIPIFDSLILQKLFTNRETLDFLETFDLSQIEKNLLTIVPEMAKSSSNNFATKYIKTKKSIEQFKEENPATPGIEITPNISGFMIGVFDKSKRTEVISLIEKMPDFKSVNDSMQLYWHCHPFSPDSLELFSLKKGGLHEFNIYSNISGIRFKEKQLLKIFKYDNNNIPVDWGYISLPHIEIDFNSIGSNRFHKIVQNNVQKELLFSFNNMVITDYYAATPKFKQTIELSAETDILEMMIWELFLKELYIDYKDTEIRLTEHNQ